MSESSTPTTLGLVGVSLAVSAYERWQDVEHGGRKGFDLVFGRECGFNFDRIDSMFISFGSPRAVRASIGLDGGSPVLAMSKVDLSQQFAGMRAGMSVRAMASKY